MKINLQKMRSRAIILGLLMMLSVTLAACVNTDSVGEILDTGDIIADVSDDNVSEEDLPCAEGQTKAPSVTDIVHLETMKVAIYGECETGATVKCVAPGDKVYETKAHGTYYILEVDLVYESGINLLNLSATAEGKDESVARELEVKKDATAGGLVDGNNVSVGVDSRLYFDRMVSYDLFNINAVNAIRNSLNDKYTQYSQECAVDPNKNNIAQEVEIIYVFVPNVTTVYPEIIPEGVNTSTTTTTRYNQVVGALSGDSSKVSVINMYDIFAAKRDEAATKQYGGLYRETDSSLTDYGSYLIYETLMNHIAVRFPDAAPKAITEFETKTVKAVGGNLVTYRGMDSSVINEDLVLLTPKFLAGLKYTDRSQVDLSKFIKYNDAEDGDYSFYTAGTSDPDVIGLNERWFVETVREEGINLPSAHIYRDNTTLGLTDILAERFECALFTAANGYNLDIMGTKQSGVKSPDQAAVDYIIVFVTEDNLDQVFANEIATSK